MQRLATNGHPSGIRRRTRRVGLRRLRDRLAAKHRDSHPLPSEVGQSETPPQEALGDDTSSGGDLPASAVLIAIVLAIMAMLLMVARQRVRPDDVQQSPGS